MRRDSARRSQALSESRTPSLGEAKRRIQQKAAKEAKVGSANADAHADYQAKVLEFFPPQRHRFSFSARFLCAHQMEVPAGMTAPFGTTMTPSRM
jgi:hypothetical protein